MVQKREYRILCVHPNDKERQNLFAVLSEYSVAGAATAFDAIRASNARSFHAVLLGQWLPDLPGVQLCRELRGTDPHVPMIFYAAPAREEHRLRAFRAGATAYVEEPVDGERLIRQLRTALELSELRSRRAKAIAERALAGELQREDAYVSAHPEVAARVERAALERIARRITEKAFIEAGGIRAYFEQWWAELVEASHQARPSVRASPLGAPATRPGHDDRTSGRRTT